MTAPVWQPLGTVDPLALSEIRDQSHHALQWLNHLARAYVPPVEDQSHSNFGWDFDHGAFTTRDIATVRGTVTFGLRLADLTLVEIREGSVGAQMPLDGRTNGDVRGWIVSRLEEAGLAVDRFETASPWEMPPHPVAEGATYTLAGRQDGLAELTAYFHDAAIVLQRIRERYTDIQPGPEHVRTWPHHYDMAFLTSLEEGDFHTARAVGAGFCPGDKAYDQPYFFTYPWPRKNRPSPLPALVTPGQWTREGVFFGTVLTGADLVRLQIQETTVETYLIDAIGKCRTIAEKATA